MSIRFTCPCGKLLQAQEQHAGLRTRCPACNAELSIPSAPESSPPEPSAPREETVRREPPPPPLAAEGERPTPRRPREERGYGEDETRRRTPEVEGASGKALAALLLGIASFCTWFLTGLPALIVAILSIRDINRSGGRLTGKPMAIVGLILGGVNTLCLCPGVLGVGYFIKSKADEARGKVDAMNHMKVLGMAMHSYHDAYGRFPAAAAKGKSGQTVSWRVEVLPFFGQDGLYRQFRTDDPWDAPHNMRLATPMPRTFEAPHRSNEDGKTFFQVLTSPPNTPHDPASGPLFGGPSPPRLVDIVDGSSNTILLAEAADNVTWSRPVDLIYERRAPLPKFGDPSKSFFLVVLADGSVRQVSRTVSEPTLRAAITPAGGEVLGSDW